MATGVYMTKGVYDIFDSMEKLGLKKINRIIGDLNSIYANSPSYTEIITLTKEKLTVNTLKSILGLKYTDKELDEFVKVFVNLSKGSSVKYTDKNSIRIKFTDDFAMMLDKIDDELSWGLFDISDNAEIKNIMGIEKVDVSNTDFNFDLYYPNGKRREIKIVDFVRTYLGNKYNRNQLYDFIKKYNRIKNKSLNKSEDTIEVPDFKFNPKDVRSTFISLVTETYPHGHEEGVYKYLPDLNQDKYGNLYKIIGESDTLFTSHLDTASRDKSDVVLLEKNKNGQVFIMSDGTTILGADDKAGVAVMLYMMEHNVPGVYYFFLGEERGGIGSGKVADDFDSFPFLKDVKKCVSFDRRNYYSIITEQMSTECCSSEFAQSLCKELNKSGLKLNLDPTGIFTDSANFIDLIPECTNISVGYFNEHTHDEIQNITYLIKLAEACVAVNWDKLKIKRKIGIDSAVLAKWSDLIADIKGSVYFNEVTYKGVEGKFVINIEFDDASLRNAYDDLASIEVILMMHRCNPNITFDGNSLKIQIS